LGKRGWGVDPDVKIEGYEFNFKKEKLKCSVLQRYTHAAVCRRDIKHLVAECGRVSRLFSV